MDIEQPYQLLFLICTLLTLLTHCGVLFIVVKKSPPSMKEYAQFLITPTLSEMIFTFLYGFVIMPEPPSYFPGCGYEIKGVVSQEFIPFSVSSVFFSVMFTYCSQFASLLYRFLAVQTNRQLKTQFAKWNGRIYTFIFIVCLIPTIVFFNCVAQPEEFQDLIDAFNPNHPPVDLSVKRTIIRHNNRLFHGLLLSLGFFLFLSYTLFIVLVISILKTMKRNANRFSRRTFLLSKQLTYCLIAQLITPLIVLVGPFFSLVVQIHTKPMDNRLRVQITSIVFCGHSLLSALAIITLIHPYRHFVLSFGQKLMCSRRVSGIKIMKARSTFSTTV
ncbi:hypothetical protein M3Y96_00133500 [Aphelenchoides besseyi]|nr:hypothetical protein M3Y96_00133500 [Aphelenchoides besseyi]